MAIMSWKNAVKMVRPHVVKILTPRGSGTGFLCAYSNDKKIIGIATAAHVVDQSHYWEEPIRIQHFDSKKTKLLRAFDRSVWLGAKFDTAVILFNFDEKELPLPNEPLKFISKGTHLMVGIEIGWVGFPAVSSQNLCFFAGKNSCWVEDWKTYLVDGVAINGVSGGPAFCRIKNSTKVIGSVSAYLPNRLGATPGLAMISDVDQFQNVIKTLKDWKEAKEKETPPTETKEEEKKETDKNNKNT